MANKKIDLPKAPGTDSRGNIKVPGGAKVLDLSDYDDIFGDTQSDKKQSGWEQFKGGFKSALADRLNTKDVVRNFLRSAAPEGINSLFGVYDDLKGSITSIKDSLEQTNAADLDYIARQAKDYLPQLKDYLPKDLMDTLDAGLDSKIDDYKYTIQASRDQTQIRAQSKAAQEDTTIQEALDNIALVSKQNQNRSERATNYREKIHRAEKGLRDVVQSKRFDYLARTMGMTVDSLSQIKNYQEQFDSGVKRKGLELQFRTYMGIKDLVKLAETSLSLQASMAEQLVINTGTPDYQKGKNSDLRKFQMGQKRRPGLISGAVGGTARSLQGYLGGFGGQVEDRVKRGLGGRLSDIVSMARMGEGSPDLWDQRYSLAGGMAGEFAGSMIQDHLIPMAGRELKPTATKLMNKYGGGRHNQLSYIMDNIPAYAQEFMNNQQNQYGAKGFLRDLVAPYIPTHSLQDRLEDGTYQTIDQQASFNQMTQRSIVEIIPGYLSRALQELRMIRTGRSNIDREVFDITTGKFTIERAAHDNLQKRIIPDSAINAASSTINDTLNKMDSDGKLSPEARKTLAERMLREASNNKRFDPEQYLKSRGYKDGTKSEISDELASFFREKFKFSPEGKMAETSDNHELRQEWSQAFLDIRAISRDPYKEIQRLISSGNTEPLRMMGIIITEGNQDKINYDRIWEILRSGVTDINPYGPGGPGDDFDDPHRDDTSGDQDSDDFVGPRYDGELKRFGLNLARKARKRFDNARDEYGPDIQDAARKARDKFNPAVKAARDATAKRIRALRASHGDKVAKIAELVDKLKSGEIITPEDKERAKQQLATLTKNWANSTSGIYDNLKGKMKEGYAEGTDYVKNLMSEVGALDIIPEDIKTKIQERIGEMSGEYSDKISGYGGKVTDFASSLMGGAANNLPSTITSAYDKAIAGLTAVKSASYVPPGMDKLTDLYSKFDPSEPLIKAIDFIKGNLIDVNTRAVITKPSDITGAVINQMGLTVATAREVSQGLYSDVGDTVVTPLRLLGQQAMAALGRHTDAVAGPPPMLDAPTNPDEPQDLSLSPGEDVVITARGIKDGEYFNRTTGKVVTSMEDLNGDIVDKDGNVVVTAQEVEEGLYNYKSGKKWKLTKKAAKIVGAIGKLGKFSGMTATQLGFHAIKFMGKAALGIAASAFNFAVENQNAYLPDSPDPVFTRRALKAGEYFDEKGKVVDDFLHSYSLIYGKDGQPVIPLNQYKDLKNYDGSPHQLAKNQGKFARTGLRAMRAVRGAYIRASVRYWKWLGRKTASVGGKIGRKLFGGFAKMGGNLIGKIFEKGDPEAMANPTNIILAQILGQLQANEPPPPEREGSWKDKAKKAAASMGDKLQNKGKDKDGKQGLLGSLLGGLGKLMGGKNKDEEEDDGFGLEDAADLADIGGTADEAAERRRGRRRRRRGGGGGGGTGKWAKIKDWMKKIPGVSVAGGLLMRGAAYVAAPIMTGLAALLSAPAAVLIGGATVVGGVGFLAWRQWKAAGDFKYLRMMQYGATFTGEKLDTLKLEAVLEKYVDKSSPNPVITINADNAKDVLSAMGIKIENAERVMQFSRWLDKRFKPIFIAYCKALGALDLAKVSLYDIDDKVPEEKKAELLQAVQFPYEEGSPYLYLESPYEQDGKLPDTIPEIKAQVEKLTKKFAVAKKEAEEKKAAEQAKSEGKDPAVAKAAAGTAAAAATVTAADLKKETLAQATPPGVTKAVDNVKNAVRVAALSGTVAMATPQEKVGRELTSLQSIRMRAYGLQTLSIADVESLMTLEYVYSRDLTITNGEVDYTGDFQVFLREAGTYLGISTAVGSDSRNKLSIWLSSRFAAAFRAYWAAVVSRYPSVQLNNVESQLKISDKIMAANAIMGATDTMGDSIWEIDSIFEVTGNLSTLKDLAEMDLKHLKEVGDKDIAGTPTQKASEQVAGKTNSSMGGSFTDSIKAATQNAWDTTKSAVSGAIDKVSGFFGGEKKDGNLSFPEGGYSNTTGNTVTSQGVTFGELAKGNGGKWEDVPMPTANGTAKGASGTFKAAAAMVGVPVELLFVIAGIESGYKYNIKAKPSINKKTGEKSKESSAYGWFQFLNTTWDEVYSKVIRDFGAPADDDQRSKRLDPRLQALAGAVFIKGNYDRLKKALGRAISDTDVYIAHFLGFGGALKFLKADPNALGYQVFQKEYSSNITIFFEGGDKAKPRTIAQIYKLFDDKIAKYRQGGGTPSDVPEVPGAAPNPEKAAEDQAAAAQATTADFAPEGAAPVSDTSPGKEIASTAPGGGAPDAGSLVSSTPKASTNKTDAPAQDSGGASVDAQRTASDEAAIQAQLRRQQELNKSKIDDKNVDKIQTQQLDAMIAMRDYLKIIAEHAQSEEANNEKNSNSTPSGGQATSNSMNSPVQNRMARETRSPMTLK